MKRILILILCIHCFLCYSQDTSFIKIHFLYGSRPLHKYKKTEKKWFGGVWGGHVGIESDSNRIVNFLPKGDFHWFARKNERHSRFAVHSSEAFYEILGKGCDSVKKAIVIIPVAMAQKQKFDSIVRVYTSETPYDYAFCGMRCASAAYEILGQLGIAKKYSYRKTYRKIFYPRKLRKRLFRKAEENGWEIIRQEGSLKRKWDWK